MVGKLDVTHDLATDDLGEHGNLEGGGWGEGEMVEQVLGQLSETVASLRPGIQSEEGREGDRGRQEVIRPMERKEVRKEEWERELGEMDLRRQVRRMERLGQELGQPSSPSHLYRAYRHVTELQMGPYLLSRQMYVLIRQSLLRNPDRLTDSRVAQTYWDQRRSVGLSRDETEAWAMMLVRSGKFQQAEGILQELRENGVRWSLLGWQTLLYGLTGRGEMSVARSQERRMREQGIQPDGYIYSYLILGYLREGKVEEAEELCRELCSIPPPHRGMKDRLGEEMAPLNGILLGLVLRERTEMAQEMHQWMQRRQRIHERGQH
ncbi:MAG: hypothetical protein DHS80DRAFT_28853 [Piptocephalis tieghemiana]|nr:MAG: hypothetical protein DHS80DRAFT_28853 [Piptocephalis tieghemiana]